MKTQRPTKCWDGEACPPGTFPHGTHLPCCEEVQANEIGWEVGEGGNGRQTWTHTQMLSYPPAGPAISAEVPDLRVKKLPWTLQQTDNTWSSLHQALPKF